MPYYYLVGTHNVEDDDTVLVPLFYIDRRIECEECFSSSHNPDLATMWEERADAEAWNRQHLDGNGIIYKNWITTQADLDRLVRSAV